jgi:HK97 family phage major capsid protein
MLAKTEVTTQLVRRSNVEIESMLRTLFRMSIINKIDRSIINGDGNNKPLGILQTAGINAINRTVSSDIREDDLIEMEHSISPMIRSQCIWIGADDAVKALKKKKDSTGRILFPDLSGEKPKLRGYPVVTTKITKFGDAGDLIFCYPGQYICAIEEDLILQFSDFAKMDQGVRLYVAFIGIGGAAANPLAFTKLV